MKSFLFIKQTVKALAVAGALLMPVLSYAKQAPTQSYALVEHARLKPYSHYSNEEKVSDVLTDFATQQGYVASVSGQIVGVISGKFDNVDGGTFMDAMRTAYGVGYYTAGNIMYFFHENEWTQTIVKPVSMDTGSLVNAINDSRLSSPQLPVRSDANGLVVINGPAAYVDTLTRTAHSLDRSYNVQPEMRVFKLKYTTAADLTINSMNRTIVIPGIASILQQMVSGIRGPVNGTTVVKHEARQESLAGGLKENSGEQSASSVVASMPGGGAEKRDSVNVIADSRINAVIVQDLPARMKFYEQVIRELDHPARLVELHAAIIDVDVSETDSLGIDWAGAQSAGGVTIGGAVGNLIDPTKPMNPAGGGLISTIFETGNTTFNARLNMLEQQQKARTLGRPSVITMDNIEATLEDTRTLYIPVSGYQSSDLFKVDSGTVLRVTPHIIEEDNGDRFIQLVIELQSNQNNADDEVTQATGEDGKVVVIPPAITQTRINTQALVKEGQSLLIGGYYVEYQSTVDKGLPKMKDLPAIGGLFGAENVSSYQRKRLLLITPRIVSIEDLRQVSNTDTDGFINNPSATDYNYVIESPLNPSSGCSSTTNRSAARGAANNGNAATNAGSQVHPAPAPVPDANGMATGTGGQDTVPSGGAAVSSGGAAVPSGRAAVSSGRPAVLSGGAAVLSGGTAAPSGGAAENGSRAYAAWE